MRRSKRKTRHSKTQRWVQGKPKEQLKAHSKRVHRYGWWMGLWIALFVPTLTHCDVISPGISGRVTLGRSHLISQNAQRIVVSLYKPEDFSLALSMPHKGAIPLSQKILHSVNTPPYDYELEANHPGQKAYVFAFLDQDNSGGKVLTHTDLYGSYAKNPVILTQIRQFNVGIELNKIYIRPPLQFEVTRTIQIPKPAAPNRLVVGLWKTEDMSPNNIPKADTKPILFRTLKKFGYTPWKIEVPADQETASVIPFVFLDLDGKGGLQPEKGDPYATWNGDIISLSKANTTPLSFVLDSLYTSPP